MTCVSGNNAVEEAEEVDALPPADRGVRRLLFWEGELDEEAVAVVPAGVGVREERFRAALIRTLTVDGIFSLLLSSSTTVLRYYVVVVIVFSIDVCCCIDYSRALSSHHDGD